MSSFCSTLEYIQASNNKNNNKSILISQTARIFIAHDKIISNAFLRIRRPKASRPYDTNLLFVFKL